ncbi:hypothetical protein CLOM_g1603, partial [Closterium sp. NIES-68]
LFRPITLTDHTWQMVMMDFIMALPRTVRGHDVIFVVIDIFSRATHLFSKHGKGTSLEAAMLFVDNVVRLDGVPDSIILHYDHCFTSKLSKQPFTLFCIPPRDRWISRARQPNFGADPS